MGVVFSVTLTMRMDGCRLEYIFFFCPRGVAHNQPVKQAAQAMVHAAAAAAAAAAAVAVTAAVAASGGRAAEVAVVVLFG